MQIKILDIVPKAIAVLTSMLIFLGITSSAVYYRSFSINILDQINLGEALLLFVSRFSSFSIGALFGVIIGQFFLIQSKNQDKGLAQKEQYNANPISLSQKIYAVFVIIPLFLLSFMGFSPFSIWVIPLALIVRLYVLFYILKKLRMVFEYRKLNVRILDYIRIAGLSIIVIAGIAMTEAYFVYTQKTGKEVTLYYVNGEIKKTDSATLYLGKSLSFYYLYHKPTEKAIIIRADQINKVEIEKKR